MNPILFLLTATLAATTPSLQRDDGLLPLTGDYCQLLYPADHLDRASHLLRRFEISGLELHRWWRAPVVSELLVLGRQHWQEVLPEQPYGLPARLPDGTLAVAAAGDAGTVALWEKLLDDEVPPVPGRPLLGTREEASSLILCDTVLQLEIGRSFTYSVGFAAGSSPWPAEVMAHVATISLLEVHDPGQQQLLTELFARWGADPDPRELSLWNDSLPARERFWYHARFHEAARIIWEQDGKHAVSKLQRTMRRNERDPVEVILKKYPKLAAWLLNSFAAPP